MAAEWGLNPEAVGALGSAASAILAVVAACVAVWAGVFVPRRLQRDAQRQQLLMIGPKLRGELSAIQFRLGLYLGTWKEETYFRSEYADIAAALECPSLSASLASGIVFPEAETHLMVKVQEDAQLLASLLLTESKLQASIPGMRQRYKVRVEELLRTVTQLLEMLHALTGVNR